MEDEEEKGEGVEQRDIIDRVETLSSWYL